MDGFQTACPSSRGLKRVVEARLALQGRQIKVDAARRHGDASEGWDPDVGAADTDAGRQRGADHRACQCRHVISQAASCRMQGGGQLHLLVARRVMRSLVMRPSTRAVRPASADGAEFAVVCRAPHVPLPMMYYHALLSTLDQPLALQNDRSARLPALFPTAAADL